jgi:hypothetical protein
MAVDGRPHWIEHALQQAAGNALAVGVRPQNLSMQCHDRRSGGGLCRTAEFKSMKMGKKLCRDAVEAATGGIRRKRMAVAAPGFQIR